jgi:iron(III) transport system substrate-binding protein
MLRSRLVVIGLFAAVFTTRALVPAAAADQALIDAAKKEGELTWYTSLIINQAVKPMAEAFEKKYGIKVNYVRYDSTDLVVKIMNEAQAGKIYADVFDGTSGSPALKRANALNKWLPDAAANMPPAYHDPEGYWTAATLFVIAFGYNTDQVKKEDAPQSLEDLLNPRWKGKLSISSSPSSPGVGGFIGFVLRSMGEERGADYLKRLGGHGLHVSQFSSRQVADQVIAGEYPIAVQILDHQAAFSANRGAPIGWVQIKPATMVSMLVLSSVKGPHQNAGKLMIDFLLSDEGQAIFRDADYIPVSPNVPPKDASLRPDGINFKALYFDPEIIDVNQPKWMDLYQQYLR